MVRVFLTPPASSGCRRLSHTPAFPCIQLQKTWDFRQMVADGQGRAEAETPEITLSLSLSSGPCGCHAFGTLPPMAWVNCCATSATSAPITGNFSGGMRAASAETESAPITSPVADQTAAAAQHMPGLYSSRSKA